MTTASVAENNVSVIQQESPQTTIELVLTKAIEMGSPIEVMERLLAMRKELKAEAAREAFFAAKSEFQRIRPSIPKRYTVMNRDGQTPRYRYAKLDDIVEAIQAPLASMGLSYEWKTDFIKDGQDHFQITSCIVTHVAGHSEISTFKVPVEFTNAMNRIQSFASAGTYAKRYSLCNALGITPDEDDDAATSTIGEERQQPGNASNIREPQEKQQGSWPPPVGQLLHVKSWNVEENAKEKWKRFDVWFDGYDQKTSTFSETDGATAKEARDKKLPVIAEFASKQKGNYLNWNLTSIEIQQQGSLK